MSQNPSRNLLFVTAGSHGDINPFIALACACRDRGHQATIATNPYFEAQVVEAGLSFVPLGDRFDLRTLGESYPDVMHPRKGGRVVLEAMMVPMARAAFEFIRDISRQERIDAVVHHFICFGAAWACNQAGIPSINTVLAPLNWLSRSDVFSPMSWSPVHPPRWMQWALFGAIPLVSWTTDRYFRKVCSDLGLPKPRRVIFDGMRAGHLNLGLWSPAFRPPMDGDPTGGKVCGFAWYDRHGAVESDQTDLCRFLEDGEPPILFSLGSAAVHVAGDFFSHAAEACRILKCRGLLLIGPGCKPSLQLPSGVKCFDYAPFSTVMNRCRVNVHHGGIGSTGQGLRAGKPTLVIPHAHDQFDNAARLKRLGVSDTIPRPRVSAHTLVRALRGLLHDPGIASRAAEVGRRIQSENGASEAASHIEAFLGMARSVKREQAVIDSRTLPAADAPSVLGEG